MKINILGIDMTAVPGAPDSDEFKREFIRRLAATLPPQSELERAMRECCHKCGAPVGEPCWRTEKYGAMTHSSRAARPGVSEATIIRNLLASLSDILPLAGGPLSSENARVSAMEQRDTPINDKVRAAHYASAAAEAYLAAISL